MEADPTSPFFADRMQCFVKGSIILAAASNLLTEALANTEAVQATQHLQAKRNKKSLQKEGVMYAQNACTMIKKGKKMSFEKLKQLLLEWKQKMQKMQKKSNCCLKQ